MKTTRSILLLLLSCFFLSSTCSKDYTPSCPQLQLYNGTDKSVYVLYSFDYPDTSFNFQNPKINPDAGILNAYSKGAVSPYKYKCLEHYFDDDPGDRISVFVFDKALVDTMPWQQIRQNYQVLKRYDLSKDELINSNYNLDLP